MYSCKICNNNTTLFGEARILKKYDIKYYQCNTCGFLQTEKPYWLDEAYSSVITKSDIGLLWRNVRLSHTIPAVLKKCFPKCQKFLDYGGGMGILTRLMRDEGFDYYWYDAYCENVFAQGFEKRDDKYDLLTAIELFEHLPDPMDNMRIMFGLADNIIFTTETIPSSQPPPFTDWYYYGLEHGQHISFYTLESLRYIAKMFNKNYVHYGSFHVFSEISIQIGEEYLRDCIKNHYAINRSIRKPSLLESDHQAIVKALSKEIPI